MKMAAEQEQVFFSQFDYYPARQTDSLSSIYRTYINADLMIYGLDFYYATGTWFAPATRNKNRKNIIQIVRLAWEANHAIPCFSWHLENPYTPSSYKEKMACRYMYSVKGYPQEHRYVIREILNNTGSQCGVGTYSKGDNPFVYTNPREWFEARTDEVAAILDSLIDSYGRPIPCILRLWHECEDNWMWWGNGSTTKADYKSFYILTRQLIESKTPRSQIIWAYCTDSYCKDSASYMSRYPGDEYVDMIGYDDYTIGTTKDNLNQSIKRAQLVSRIARERGKVAALFETDNKHKQSRDVFFSEYINPLLSAPDVNLSMVQVWSIGYFKTEADKEDRKSFIQQKKIIKAK